MNNKQQRFYSGLLFIGTGLLFGGGALYAYPVGTAASMGPGYFPFLLSAMLVILGTIILGKAAKETVPHRDPASSNTSGSWRPLICVLTANFTFGVLLKGLPIFGIPEHGLVPSIFVATYIASLASSEHRPKPALILAATLSTFFYLVFIVAMGLPIQAWPSYFSL